MTTYIPYETAHDDRWDLIAWKMYGDPWAFVGIIAANPTIPIVPILPAGLTVLVPVRERPSVGSLPPWRRP